MWGSDWQLCASVVDGGLPYLYLVKRATVVPRMWLYQIVPGQLPTFIASALIPPATPHFPWGEPVDPD